MNDFDRQWQNCVARARETAARPDSAPFGFATRVLARAGRGGEDPTPGLLWVRFALRALSGVVAVMLVLGVLEYRDSRERGWSMPGVENCVAQTLWML